MTEIQEIHMPSSITCYMLLKLSTDGNLVDLKPTYGTHKMLGGLWGDVEEAKYEQLMQSLKGNQYRLFKIDWRV